MKGCNQHSIRVFYISMVMRIPGNVSAMVGKNEKEAEDRRRIPEEKEKVKTEREPAKLIITVKNMGDCLKQLFSCLGSALCSVGPRPNTPTRARRAHVY